MLKHCTLTDGGLVRRWQGMCYYITHDTKFEV